MTPYLDEGVMVFYLPLPQVIRVRTSREIVVPMTSVVLPSELRPGLVGIYPVRTSGAWIEIRKTNIRDVFFF
jgi:hypothetical protein